MRKFLGIGWLPALAAMVAVALTIALGNWQMRRADQKLRLQQQMAAASQEAPVMPSDWSNAGGFLYRQIAIRGAWVPQDVVYLDNRPYQGRAGFYVLMPLKLEGPGKAAIIVNRGWLPRDAVERTRIPHFSTPTGVVLVRGVAIENEPKLLELGKSEAGKFGGIWQNFDFDAFRSVSLLMPIGLILRQEPSGGANVEADGLVRDWPDRGAAIAGQIDRHHGYAFQWYALSALISFLTLFYGYRNGRKSVPVGN